ncbi:MAG: hypothetical protein QXS93_01980 [Candidatus Micrarchaeia archaeon]
MNRQAVFVIGLLLIIVLVGCTNPPEQHDKKVDVSVVSLSSPSQEIPVLGSKYKIKVETASTSEEATYRVDIKVDGERTQSYSASGNLTKELELPASRDGQHNITAVVLLLNASFIDTNISNDFKTLPVKVLPYGNYTAVINRITKTAYYECNTSSTNYCKKEEVFYDVDNYTSISERRTYGMLLHFDADTEIFSIGTFLRRNFMFSPNSTLNYSIYPVVNNTPSRESVMRFSTSLFNLGGDWGSISILRRKTQQGTLPAGDYVLEISVSEGASADIACFAGSPNSTTFMRTSPSPIRPWYPGPNCTANIIISSRNELETYKEYMAANGMQEAQPS